MSQSITTDDAIEEADLDLELSIRDVFEHKDGTYHIRLDTCEEGQ